MNNIQRSPSKEKYFFLAACKQLLWVFKVCSKTHIQHFRGWKNAEIARVT